MHRFYDSANYPIIQFYDSANHPIIQFAYYTDGECDKYLKSFINTEKMSDHGIIRLYIGSKHVSLNTTL